MGARTIQRLCRTIASQAEAIAALTEANAVQHQRFADMAEAKARDERTIDGLLARGREAAFELEVLRGRLAAAPGLKADRAALWRPTPCATARPYAVIA